MLIWSSFLIMRVVCERADVKEPFSEVSLFKKNFDHLPKETYFGHYKEATRGNPNYFLTYGNGKSVARIQDHLRRNGAHRWHTYVKTPKEVKLDEAAVLHFTYSKYSDLTSRRDRCGCKPTKEDVKRCFMLEFDRAAFIIASTATQEEMFNCENFLLIYRYKEHVVWGNTEVKYKLLKKGILTRIYTPMVIIQGLKEAGVFSNVIKSARAGASESQRNQSSEGGKSTNGTSAMSLTTASIKYQAAARKMLEAAGAGSGSGSDHPMAVPPLPPPVIDEVTTSKLSVDE